MKAKSFQLKQLLGPLHKKLLKSNKDAIFYTGLPKLEVFYILAKYIQQYIRRKEKKPLTLTIQLKYRKAPLSLKHNVKLCIEDKILLVLMKLRLGLLNKDLADR